MMIVTGRDIFKTIILVSILIISSCVPMFNTGSDNHHFNSDEEIRYSTANQSYFPFVLPLGVLSPWHNESSHILDIEYNGMMNNYIDFSSLSKSISEFHAIRLSIPANNNQIVKLYIEESPNQDKCRTYGAMYSNLIKMYLLRTDVRNLSNEANGYSIEYYDNIQSHWQIEGQIYGEWMNSTQINSWRLDIYGNSSNKSVVIHDLGITNNRGVNQFVNNSIPSITGYYNGLESITQLHYRLIRLTLMYERAKVEDICRTILQTENILRNKLGIQLYVERFYDLVMYNGLSNPGNVTCEKDPLLADIQQHHESWSNLWNTSQSPFGLRGNTSSPHFDSIDTVFYYGSLHDQNINYSKLFHNGIPRKLGCATGTLDNQKNFIGLGVGWALMDFHPSDQWNSVHLFTQLISKAIGGLYSQSDVGMGGLEGRQHCHNDIDSNNPFNSILVKSIITNYNNNSGYPPEIVNEECYGIIPTFSEENFDSILNTTQSLPFMHVQPDWSKHWKYRWSFFGDVRLRQWYVQLFNAVENYSYYGIQGNPHFQNQSTIIGPDPLWRIRWTMERTIWNIPNWNQTSYWQNDILFMSWFTGVRVITNGTTINMDNLWLQKCRSSIAAHNLSLGQILGYADGWSQNTGNFFGPINQHLYGTLGWGVISCHEGSNYLPHLTEYHSANPQYVNKSDEAQWFVYPSIQNVTIPWLNIMNVRDIHFDHIGLIWFQSN